MKNKPPLKILLFEAALLMAPSLLAQAGCQPVVLHPAWRFDLCDTRRIKQSHRPGQNRILRVRLHFVSPGLLKVCEGGRVDANPHRYKLRRREFNLLKETYDDFLCCASWEVHFLRCILF